MVQNNLWDIAPGFDWNEEMDFNDVPSWFLDVSHSWPPATPMSCWFWTKLCSPQGMAALSELSAPTLIGAPKRAHLGGFYSGFLIAKDKEEVKQREAANREAMKPFIDDFSGWWEKSKKELMAMFDEYKSFDLDNATNAALLNHLYDIVNMGRRMWYIHYVGMEAVFNGWVLFEELCTELFGLTDTNPEFLKLMVGFDTKIFQVDKRLYQLGREAADKGLYDVFMTSESSEVVARLDQMEEGKEWLKEFRDFLKEHGWRMQRMVGFDGPTWIEDPTPAITAIKVFISQDAEFSLDKTRERLTKVREETANSIIQKVPRENKDGFIKLLRLAQQAGVFSEEHTYYCEMYCHAVIRRSLLGIGRRLNQCGAIDNSEDILFINPDEAERAVLAPEYSSLRSIVDRRRKEWQEWHKMDRPMVLTRRQSIQEALEKDRKGLREPIIMKVTQGELPKVIPELKADFYGLCGSPGVVEGKARVIAKAEQLREIKSGEILVVPNTATSWTPYFTLIKGLIIDRGGTLGHGSVVGREYRIPVVTNTLNAVGELEPASRRIKTGQEIRLDGTQGLVYVRE